ncbi:MAG: DNA recombination protein RmuC, partial [Mariniphaga sp.]|nr:DNA recombination protein RmuC [Mariniphaga sp.]
VKTKGVLGEYQLENILDQLLTPAQYEKNVKTKYGSNALVEFAIKLPGRENRDKTVWLPIDAKFPTEDYLNLMDIYVAMSRSESFGVAILEASACQLPVVVSNIGGLPEVVQDKITGFIVGSEDVEACADALVSLVKDRNLRNQMGKAGRKFVKEHYEWTYCSKLMLNIYQHAIQ